jgi:hypothetical protein
MREGEVAGSNPAGREAHAFCLKNAATYNTPSGGFPGLKNRIFLSGFVNFQKRGG